MGPLLFSFFFFIYELFFDLRELEYTSLASLLIISHSLPAIITILEKHSKEIQSMFYWFSENL